MFPTASTKKSQSQAHLRNHSPRRPAGPWVLALTTLALLGLLVAPAHADGNKKGKSRVVVVAPEPGGAPVPVGPNEKVGAATVVNTPGGPVAVVRIDQMPPKPSFNIITPDGISHPFTNGPTGVSDISVTWQVVYVHAPGGDYYSVVGTFTKPGRGKVGSTSQKFPVNSQIVPDPPQPPGTVFMCPDAQPLPPLDEAIVLAELGLPDNPWSEVWSVPSGDFIFWTDTAPPEIVQFKLEPDTADVQGDVLPAESLSAAPLPGAVFRESFDGYALDSSLHGQGGWRGWDNNAAATGYVTDEQSRSTAQALEVADATDLIHELDGIDAGRWSFSTWQYIPADFQSGGTGQFAGSYFVMMNAYEDGGPHEAEDWSVQMQFDSNDGMLKVYDGNGTTTVQVPYVPDQWKRIRVIVDLDEDWTQVYYDDDLVTEYPWTGGVLGTGGGASATAAVDLYANGSSPVYYDDLVVKPLNP